jgi:hypothetical protein
MKSTLICKVTLLFTKKPVASTGIERAFKISISIYKNCKFTTNTEILTAREEDVNLHDKDQPTPWWLLD